MAKAIEAEEVAKAEEAATTARNAAVGAGREEKASASSSMVESKHCGCPSVRCANNQHL